MQERKWGSVLAQICPISCFSWIKFVPWRVIAPHCHLPADPRSILKLSFRCRGDRKGPNLWCWLRLGHGTQANRRPWHSPARLEDSSRQRSGWENPEGDQGQGLGSYTWIVFDNKQSLSIYFGPELPVGGWEKYLFSLGLRIISEWLKSRFLWLHTTTVKHFEFWIYSPQ